MKKNRKNNKGFSLVELVIVVAILAILVGILAPQYTKYVEKSRKAADVNNLEELVKGFQVLCADPDVEVEPGTYVITIDDSGAKITKDATAVASEEPAAPTTLDIEDRMKEFAGDTWKTSVKLKSTKWTKTKGGTELCKPMAISAECVLSMDGGVSVTYSPEWIKQISSTEGE